MRVLLLTPGTGNFFCGSCLRDIALGDALRGLGHDVRVAPLYLPLVIETDGTGIEPAIRMGGINVYLQQKSGLAPTAAALRQQLARSAGAAALGPRTAAA